MKNYLTPELIKWVENSAADPIWQMGILASMKKDWYGVLRVSPIGLIHIHGNRDTGWAHIINRHAYYSNDFYFGEGALGNPSRFQSSGLPIFDWVPVADDLYRSGQIDTKEHADGELFVKYTGHSARFCASNGEMKDFILILYRGTKIVHSLYPKKNLQADTPGIKLKNLRRALDDLSAEKPFLSQWLTVRIPYYNSDITERYVIVVYIDLNADRGNAHLQVNWPNGQPYFSIYRLMEFFNFDLKIADVDTNNLEFTRFMNTFTKYGDFTHIEEVMGRTNQKLFEEG
ncbi:hypothetical protein [Mucilaginibacter sp. UYCu711]|uniref:hypothetical protein n=1 Tax=Mucilaginibacter sp. UYCu711 TaxID=3156339 RepID=UPI003D259A99